MADEKIKVRIKPLHAIGGIGEAGAEVRMTRAEVDYYLAEGYIEILTPSDTPPMAPPAVPAKSTEPEDHAVMKPQSKRSKK